MTYRWNHKISTNALFTRKKKYKTNVCYHTAKNEFNRYTLITY